MIEQDKVVLYQRLLVAYAYFVPIAEEHIDRFASYDSSVMDTQEGIAVEIRMIGKVVECVHQLANLGVDAEALVDVLVELSFDSWQKLLQEYPNCLSQKESLSLLLRTYFLQEDWDSLFASREPLVVVTHKMMSHFSRLGLMNWWEVVDISCGTASQLHVFDSFHDAIFVFLNVHADNTGFDVEEDRKDLAVLRVFFDEIMAR